MIKLLGLSLFFFVLSIGNALAVNVPISLFPIHHYNQNVNVWINPKNFPNYHQNLLKKKAQEKYFADFKWHWLSAWNPKHVKRILEAYNPSINSLEREILSNFNNKGKPSNHKNYGSNFRMHNNAWIIAIKDNVDLDALRNLVYKSENRAILLANAEGRALPTNDVSFYRFTLPGQGYPFDNLQLTSIWAGTPVYVIAKSKDQAWSMILTPDIIAWVPSNTLAFVDQKFVRRWRRSAQSNLAAIIHTKTPFKSNKHFYFSAFVGSIFPLTDQNALLFPVLVKNGFATIASAKIPKSDFAKMPYTATPQHFATIITTLIGRPYGWGGMYFHNDCSQELQSLYAVFGIWLPRNSSKQVSVGHKIDKGNLSPQKRIQYLKHAGHPLMSIVYIKGHIIQYIGDVTNPRDPEHKKMVLTYQNVWGLHPRDNTSRAVIGKSVFLPLLSQYPEDKRLASLASKSVFQVSNLDVYKPVSREVDLPSIMLP